MISKEEFELQKNIVDWLVSHGCKFREAMAIVSFADVSENHIPRAYVSLMHPETSLGQICGDERAEEDS